MRHSRLFLAIFALGGFLGCATIVGADFDGYGVGDGSTTGATSNSDAGSVSSGDNHFDWCNFWHRRYHVDGRYASTGGTGGGAATADLPCDPFASATDPAAAAFKTCTKTQQCSFVAKGYSCQPRTKSGKLGDACDGDPTCSAGLSCVGGECRVRCDAKHANCGTSDNGSGGQPGSANTSTGGAGAGGEAPGGAGAGGEAPGGGSSGVEVCVAASQAAATGYCATPCTPTNPVECDPKQRCDFVDGSPICRGRAGTGKAYSACADSSDCAANLACQQVSAEDEKTPISFCLPWASSAAGCAENENWLKPKDAPKLGGKPLGYCYGSCDPLAPTTSTRDFRACAVGQACQLIPDDVGTLTRSRCVTPTLLKLNEPCDTDCSSGLACRALLCVQYCRVGEAAGCPAQQTCSAFDNIRKLATTEYGYCRAKSCDLVAQTPCKVGEKCEVFSDYAVCQPDTGTRKVGDECVAVDDCVRGTECYGSDVTGDACLKTCRLGGNDCPNGASCVEPATKVEVDGVSYGVCTPPNCNPFNAAAPSPFVNCTGGLTCGFMTTDSAHCLAAAGTTAVGQSCTASKGCKPGDFCGFVDNKGSCYEGCRVASGAMNNPDCAAGKTCASFKDPSLLSGVEIGFCN